MTPNDRPLYPDLRLLARQTTTVPAYEQVLDRLAALLFDADDLLDMLRSPDTTAVHWAEPQVRRVYDEVNDLMKKLCD